MKELIGKRIKCKVPVQFGKTSHYSRVCIVKKMESAGKDDQFITLVVAKGEKGAGRRIKFFANKDWIKNALNNAW